MVVVAPDAEAVEVTHDVERTDEVDLVEVAGDDVQRASFNLSSQVSDALNARLHQFHRDHGVSGCGEPRCREAAARAELEDALGFSRPARRETASTCVRAIAAISAASFAAHRAGHPAQLYCLV